LQESSGGGVNATELGEVPTRTFATTVTTATVFSGTVDPAVLATSNGRREQIKGHLGSTTKGKVLENKAVRKVIGRVVGVGVGVIGVGVMVVVW
jgi:hypothetical protein